MSFFTRLTVLFVLFISTALAVPIHGPHQHGTLAVALIKEDSFLTFRMVVPAQDLLGFEDSPVKPEQKKKLNDQYAKLYKEEALSKLFKFEPADTCWAYSADMDSEMLDYHEHPDDQESTSDPKDIHKVGDEKGHSDFELIYTFECGDIDSLQITFHEVFPSIKKVDFYGKGEFKDDAIRSVPATRAIVDGSELK
ncbi:DUF2796 domain-containing protein [Leucothrix sargassi]|nr:DUF2796 domain-containing protein [Leucothrix sargassi]